MKVKVVIEDINVEQENVLLEYGKKNPEDIFIQRTQHSIDGQVLTNVIVPLTAAFINSLTLVLIEVWKWRKDNKTKITIITDGKKVIKVIENTTQEQMNQLLKDIDSGKDEND